MFTRKQALLTLALMSSLPLASWAATEAASAAAPTTPVVQPCPFGGPDGAGPGMMRQGKMMGRDGGRHSMMRMHDTEQLQARLDDIKDPTVKAKFIDMMKAHVAYEEAQLNATKAFLDKQK